MSKKLNSWMLAGSALLSAHSFAGEGMACTVGLPTTVSAGSGTFINDSITPKCSNHVSVAFNDTGTVMAVKGASARGMHTFGGSTTLGGVFQCESSSVASPTTGLSAQTTGC